MDTKRYLLVAGFLLFIWMGFMIFFYLKADEITKDPCSICSKRMGESVICTTGDFIPIKRVYYENGSIYDDSKDISIKSDRMYTQNWSKFVINESKNVSE